MIAHAHDFSAALISCLVCYQTQVWKPTSPELRIKLKERTYRPLTRAEFAAKIATLEHLCCEPT